MAKTFIYKAKDLGGQVYSGSITAENEAAVAATIREQGRFITQIKEFREPFWKSFTALVTPVNIKDLAIFCRQFATMVDAGLSVIVCLNVLEEQAANKLLKGAIRDVSRLVQEGETVSRAMKNYPQIFPELMISMIEAAETGGVMDTVLNRLASHFEKQHKLNEKVKSALIYPIVVLALAVVAVTFILVFVLPTFLGLFNGMKMALPLPTRILLAASDLLQNYGLELAAAMAVGGYVLKIYLQKPKISQALNLCVMATPIFGNLWRKVALARFSRTLGTLIRGGVPIIIALEVVKRVTANHMMINALSTAQTSVREGHSLSRTLAGNKIFTPMIIQMMAVGEEAGEFDKMLDKVADFYESDVDDIVSRLSALMEPFLIAVLALIIGFIILAVMMPMFDAITSFGKI